MKVLFMGTPEYADIILRELIKEHDVLAVVSQPDKPQGRKRKIIYSPVKKTAIENNIPLIQPDRIRRKENIEVLEAFNADVFVVAAYGQILTEKILNIPRYGCINVHGSLLPKYRGAAPIQWSLINGETETGVTIMRMDKGIDTGDMILAEKVAIFPEDTAGSLYNRLAVTGASALLKAMADIERGTARYTKQIDEEASYAPMISKETGYIDFNKTSDSIVNLVRGLSPWESAYVYLEEEIKVWNAEKLEGNFSGEAGEIVEINKNGLAIKTSDSAVLITEMQGKGGKRMDASAYARGRRLEQGMMFK